MNFDAVQNTFLILLRLDLSNTNNPLRVGSTNRPGRLERMVEGKHNYLLAAILDHSPRRANAPPLKYTKILPETYNKIIDGIESLNHLYFGEEGFVAAPDTYTPEMQREIYSKINDIGTRVKELFLADEGGVHPLHLWLNGLERAKISEDRPGLRPVTIITNDFNIPWYWLKPHDAGDALCELCSLGILHLRDVADDNRTEPPRPDGPCPTLLIDGVADNPESTALMKQIKEFLTTDRRGSSLSDRTQVYGVYSTREDSENFSGANYRSERAIRLLHFSGCYEVVEANQEPSGKDPTPKGGTEKDQREVVLLIGKDPLRKSKIARIVEDCLLVIDGSSVSRGLKAWTDIEALTAEVNSGRECALGCVLPVLPVKSDSIVGEIFWKSFYENLGYGTGFALRQARQKLRNHVGRENPIYLFYQLIGSPLLAVFDPNT